MRSDIAVHAPVDGVGGVDVFRAAYRRHTFAKHAHEALAIGVVDGGTGEFWCRGATHRVGPDSLVLIPAGEVHTGRFVDPAGPLTYRMVYIEQARLDDLIGREGTTGFATSAPRDPQAAREYRRMFDTLVDSSATVAEREAAVAALLHLLMIRYGMRAGERERRPTGRRRSARLEAARQLLHTRIGRTVTLAELSREVGLSPGYLNSAFAAEFGIPPHAYQTQLRVQRAKELVRGRDSLASIAFDLGFVDQSHFTRAFTRTVGVSPGRYRAAHASRM